MRWSTGSALVLPFVIGAVVLRLAIAPIGDAIAGDVARVARGPARGAVIARDTHSLAVPEPRRRDDAREAAMSAGPSGLSAPPVKDAKDAGAASDGGAAPSPSDAPKATIVVPASVVTRAMERRDVGATNATAPDGSPLGARLAGVSRYRTGLRDGDIVVSVAGTRTTTVAAMVATAMQAAAGGATRLSGKIMRGDATYAVVIELPAPK